MFLKLASEKSAPCGAARRPRSSSADLTLIQLAVRPLA
jgi:hypothetical protein